MKLSKREHDALVAAKVTEFTSKGWQVEGYFNDTVVMSKRKKLSFPLHLFLALITGGLSLIYVLVKLANGDRESMTIRVRDDGEIRYI